jgi:hypothetical protein
MKKSKKELKYNYITIKDENTGEEYTIKTLRTAKFIRDFLDETENEYKDDYLLMK